MTIQADIIKQKAPECNRGFIALDFAKTHAIVYDKLTSDHPIDLVRYQVAGCYMGAVGMINSAARQATTTSSRPSWPRSSTNAPAATG